MHFRPWIFSTILTAAIISGTTISHAEVRQVGPQNFHSQIKIPNTLGRDGLSNNVDSYDALSRQDLRRKQKMRNRNEQRVAGEETRTQQDKSATQKRKGRKERQKANSRRNQMRQQQQQEARSTASGVND